MPSDRTLVFAKEPRPGTVKTRLVPPLTAEDAARVYEASLHDVISTAAASRGRVELWYSGASQYFEDQFPVLQLVAQRGADLGERMIDAFERSFADNAQHVVILGSDAPTMPVDYLNAAYDGVVDDDVAIGPATDGGYYCIALSRRAWPHARVLFNTIQWSTPSVMQQTLQQAARHGIEPRVLPGWYDIDTIADLERAKTHITLESRMAACLSTLTL